MSKQLIIVSSIICLCNTLVPAQKDTTAHFGDTLMFKGQLSAWSNVNSTSDLPVWAGGRYIPQLNYELNRSQKALIDFEASAQVSGIAGFNFSDSTYTDGKLKPYRLWARYSTDQFEVRAGLQKINFGSANMLRPLMWFDRVDPRDPLRLTDGVWGVLARYYFLNNANIWLWGLYGNDKTKGWETIKSNKNEPEFGGRIQLPIPRGEGGISYHHRLADTRGNKLRLPERGWIPEDRLGVDMRLDWVLGTWVEGSWIRKDCNLSMLSNQELLNIGIDYTFEIGNGLYAVCEQLYASYDEKAFALDNSIRFSLFSLSYPIGMFNNLNAIVYYDWTNDAAYNFISWQKDFNGLSLYVMAFWNPETYNIPTQETDVNLFAGKGGQVMLVFFH